MSLAAKLEGLLLAAAKPVSFKRLAEVLAVTVNEVEAAVTALRQAYKNDERGFSLIVNHNEAALATEADLAGLVEKLITQEERGDLTKPQLEALTVVAYRGPITKMELEQIRGVNCSLILRNLQIRGLVEEVGSSRANPSYQLTTDCLRFLGLTAASDLPNFEALSNHEILQRIIEQNKA